MLLIPGMASARGIFEHQNISVPVGQTVDDVYVVGGNAEIFGQVTGVTVVVNGDLHLGRTADIKGLVVVIGGLVKQDQGAVLGDDIYNISLDTSTQNSLLIGGGIALGLWVLQLAASLLMVLIPILLRLAGKQKIAAFTDRYPLSSVRRLLVIGFLGTLILAALSALLLVTVIGIPVIILLLLMMVIALAFGSTVVSFRIGELFHGAGQMSDWMKVLVGAAILTAFVNIPFVGFILFVLLLMISIGICVQWIFRKRVKPLS
ncbi:hypothetical protein A3849_01300 [Paenibacillus sp. P46E]|nr:hypothetical protein A3849_01300 [Paenibacillus sp. P46E]